MYISDISKSSRSKIIPDAGSTSANTMTSVNNRLKTEKAGVSKHPALKIASNYAITAAICLVTGTVYEFFSHGVFSAFMVGAFLIPLLLGTMPNLFIGINGLKTPVYAAENVYACGIISLTSGSLLKGVLDIFGTTNSLLKYYFIAGAVFTILGASIYIMQKPND